MKTYKTTSLADQVVEKLENVDAELKILKEIKIIIDLMLLV